MLTNVSHEYLCAWAREGTFGVVLVRGSMARGVVWQGLAGLSRRTGRIRKSLVLNASGSGKVDPEIANAWE